MPSLGEAAGKMQDAGSRLLGLHRDQPGGRELSSSELWFCLTPCGTGEQHRVTLSHALGHRTCSSDNSTSLGSAWSRQRALGTRIPPASSSPSPQGHKQRGQRLADEEKGGIITSQTQFRTLGHPTINHDLNPIIPRSGRAQKTLNRHAEGEKTENSESSSFPVTIFKK